MHAIVLIVLLATSEVSPQPFYAPNEELRTYLLEAGEQSPILQTRHAEWQAALERVPQVTTLDDPMFTFGVFLRSEMNNYKIALGQKFPWFGTLRVRGEKAALDADAAMARFYNERNRVFSDVKTAYFEYAFLGESIRVTNAQLEVVQYMEDIVRAKYEVGVAKEDELIRISIERTKVQDRKDGFLQFKPALMARLNDSLGGEVNIERPWPQSAAFPQPLPTEEKIHSQIQAANPDLRRLEYLIQSRSKQAELAEKKGYPDFTLGLEYLSVGTKSTQHPDRPYPATFNSANRLINTLSGNIPASAANTAIDLYALRNSNEPVIYPENFKDNLMVSLKVNLPIWRKKIKAGVAEARLLENAATDEKRRRSLQLDKAAQMAVFAVEDGKRRYVLFKDSLTPQAKRSYDALQTEYANGALGTSFIDVLDSIQTLLNFELEQVRAARDWQIGAADLEFLTGGYWGNPEDLQVSEAK